MLLFFLSLINSNDINKIENLFHNYHKFMVYIANGLLDDIETAEDIVQTAFLKLIKNADKISINIEDENKTKNFIRTVVINAVKDYWRRQNRQPNEERIEEYEFFDNLPLPLEQLMSKDGYERLLNYISTLNDIYKDVCRLKFVHGYTEKEIAVFLDLPAKTVNIRIYRGRQILQKMIKESEREKNERK